MGSLSIIFLSTTLAGPPVGPPEPPEPSAITLLVDVLHDPDVEVRHYAGAALAEFGVPAIEPLRQALQDSDAVYRAGAAHALGQFGALASPAKAELLAALKDTDRDVRRQAAYAMSRLLAAEREAGIPLIAPPPPVFPKEFAPQ